jgi:Ribonuclease G/E
VQVNPDIANVIKEDEQQSIMGLEKKIKRRIIIISQNDYHMEQYTISST